MANVKTTWLQRQELHHILNWIREPVKTPFEHMTKLAIKCFLNGKDAEAFLLEKGIEAFIVKRAVERARVVLGNERSKRRMRAKEILEYRRVYSREFTYENLHVTIDETQDRNYGMVSTSIYSVIEVWEEHEEDIPEKEYLVNFSSFDTKEWLTRLMVWALTNRREVHIKPATQAEMTSMRMFTPKDKDRVGA